MAGAMKGKKGKRSGRGRKRAGKRAARRSKYEVRESASLTDVQNLSNGTTNIAYSAYNVSLNSSARAVAVSKGYQYYRIKRITYVIKPLMDTFIQAGVPQTQATVPYLYYMIDRAKQFTSGFNVNQLKAMGAKARRLDEKTLTFSFTPSVLTETYDNTQNANTAVQYKLSPWLPTRDIAQVGVWNPNTTDHLGVVWIVEQAAGTVIGYGIERRIQYEFKKPSLPLTNGVDLQVPVDSEDLLTPLEPPPQ